MSKENIVENLVIDISIDDDGWNAELPDAADIATDAINATWDMACKKLLIGIGNGLESKTDEVSLLLLGDERQQTLNRDYLGKDKPTNVLSFPTGALLGGGVAGDAPLLLGDIAIALQTTTIEAKAQKKTLANHFSHLVVHGMVHLLGFDHIETGEAETMENLETDILKELGIDNPYGS
ncbi:MAG: rRNA maturation RNase YbeY [Rhodospirillaceae bacterium]|nr:rRNA maturation RNase YbeY [Rhodospirillaceae bacterium]